MAKKVSKKLTKKTSGRVSKVSKKTSKKAAKKNSKKIAKKVSKKVTPTRAKSKLTKPAYNEHDHLVEIHSVLKAFKQGDFSARASSSPSADKIISEIGDLINDVIELNQDTSNELKRIATQVGREGRMGERAFIGYNKGSWATNIESINSLITDVIQPTNEFASVITAVAKGNLSKKMSMDIDGRSLKGEYLRMGMTVNNMVDQLNSFASEVTRVAKEVGTEGKLGGQANVKGVSGIWKDLTDNVNNLAGNLTDQVRNIAKVTTAVAKGDLSQKITVDAKGEIFELKDTINTMVDQLSSFAAEVTRVAKEVGTEGRLGAQANVSNVSGTWKDLTNNVNVLASNLTAQVRNIAKVTTAVANGDLSQKITVDAKGEIRELKNTINTMVDQLNSFAAEVTRVAKEVGTEGKLGGQANVKGVSGIWKDLTDNVNNLAGNLTDQVRNIAKVTTAVARGDLSHKITVDARGEMFELKDTINTMVDQLNSFAAEVTRVAKEVGTEGKLGGQADVKGASGMWKDLTYNVNAMASNLTVQLRDVSKVATAIATGDLGQKITVDAKGEILQIKQVINTMVDQLNSFAAEVTRVAKDVGTEGRLGGQAHVKGVSGTWKDLTDNVNVMASNLTEQVRGIIRVVTAVAEGDLDQKLVLNAKGEVAALGDTINSMTDTLKIFADQVTTVAREVGIEGKLGAQAKVPGVSGTWKDLTDNVNVMASNLTEQVRGIIRVVTAVAEGDLDQKLVLNAKGEVAALGDTINSMTDTLKIFADQVTTVAREVGIEGKLGAQAKVPGVSGTWKDLTDNVNVMASNLTEQVRGIIRVVTAVAEGDLSKKLSLNAKGEVAALGDTINSMTDTLRIFADQVTTVASEVGIEGKLGGQALVPGADGTWRSLTDNVNQLAGNLTSQVRAIAEVATAVTEGDLTRSISVEAKGEVAALKDNINQMIANLKDTTEKNDEQGWLKTNLARFSGMMQGQRSIRAVAQMIMSELTPLVGASFGAFYLADIEGENDMLDLIASYAFAENSQVKTQYRIKEGLVGQCAFEKKKIILKGVESEILQIESGLIKGDSASIVILPILFEGELKAIIELASFGEFSENHFTFFDQLMELIGVVLNMNASNMKTEELLEKLKKSNVELEVQTNELEEKAKLLEVKHQEVELARGSMQEKAEQLSLISKYKSEFLANMSHELRTPLNSLLILSRMLAENKDKNLSKEQVKSAKTIYTSGSDLLTLINEILDLSKVEAGKMRLDASDVSIPDVQDYIEQTFKPVAEHKSLDFSVEIKKNVPESIYTDIDRLNQITRNLLSNAFKFTEKGKVTFTISLASHEELKKLAIDNFNISDNIISFAVKDTGIGIPEDKQKLIFEAFQQADGTTSRKYGGTGLGLTITREIASLLGGTIYVHSEVGVGSEFKLFIPMKYEIADQPTVKKKEIVRVDFDEGHIKDIDFKGSKTLIVDDDMRNIYAITSMLEDYGMKCIYAENGRLGVEALKENPDVDIILMDVMMPEMDGLEAIQVIRKIKEFESKPIISLTAKAMAEDKENCLKAGASDYITKPVIPEKLLSMMQRWIDSKAEVKAKQESHSHVH